MLSEGNKTQKATFLHGFICMKYPEQANLQKQKVVYCLPGIEENKEWRKSTNGYGVSFGSDENILESDSGYDLKTS